jgi:hypothetical protein
MLLEMRFRAFLAEAHHAASVDGVDPTTERRSVRRLAAWAFEC